MIVHAVEFAGTWSAAVYEREFVKLGAQLRIELAKGLVERTLPDTGRPAKNYKASGLVRAHCLPPRGEYIRECWVGRILPLAFL
jgi:hypothetical protein